MQTEEHSHVLVKQQMPQFKLSGEFSCKMHIKGIRYTGLKSPVVFISIPSLGNLFK